MHSPSHSSPLIDRAPEAPFAFLTHSLPCLDNITGTLSTADFIGHVKHLAAQLPDQPHAINLCENRYLFTVAFCAALWRGQTNLLPPNKNPATVRSLAEQYPCYTLHDGAESVSQTELNVRELSLNAPTADTKALHICNHQTAAVCFTSGSTGQSTPIVKSWGALRAANTENALQMLSGLTETAYQLATVPCQHMWGLETTVLMPLLADVVMSDARPFYPADIAELAAALPRPRLLVSAPIHLRALVQAEIPLPTIDRILCATAPLSVELANQIAQGTGSDVVEIYGCSEMGSMAIRRRLESEHWRLFDLFTLQQQRDGSTLATAQHLTDSTILGDHLTLHDHRQFTLHGRTSDAVNIGGKRGSLEEFNRVLLQWEGAADGVVYLPEQTKAATRLAAMVVLNPGFHRKQLIDYLRQQLDAAFVPRPVFDVPALPRADNGKLSRQSILTLHQNLLKPTT